MTLFLSQSVKYHLIFILIFSYNLLCLLTYSYSDYIRLLFSEIFDPGIVFEILDSIPFNLLLAYISNMLICFTFHYI